MDHLAEEAPTEKPEQERRRGNPAWRPGVSANPRGRPSAAEKRAMIDAKARELSEGQFDRLGARDRELLMQAAALLIGRPRKREDMIRRANAVTRLLTHVHGLRPTSPSLPSFDEALP
jgi:hypothetical protein